ncbi:hypothetical protein [Bradyrhizobium sp.]|jgi:hypothetical protein|uniref:hypothetical protein n=1 Tax=Bradyrhizobium sp. TaxID=376 RepID=UPI002C3C4092|nr:hypothetical protein [Bradyrhizobium sp.]HWX60745.1 hypothetical protein [Bradyrhizobium sp.]
MLGPFIKFFAEWIDPATLPMELSRDPAHEKRFKDLRERNPRFSDPVYKANVRRLIEYHRQFEDAKE